MCSFWWNFIFLKFALDIIPEVFNGVQIRRLSWPPEYLNIIIFKPLFGPFGGVFGVIVLLKVSLSILHLQLFKAFQHSMVQNLTVLLCIHLSLHLYQHSNSIPTHTAPYHKIIPPSMLHSRCCGSV